VARLFSGGKSVTDDDAQSYCPIPHRDETPRKSARGTVLCGGCLGRLQRTLEELSTFDADADQAALDSKLARHDGAPLTGTGEKPLPIDPRMADLRVDARDILAATALRVAMEQHFSPPRNNLKALSLFLSRHLTWIVAQDWVEHFAAETFELGGKAAAILRPSGRRRFTHKTMYCREVVEGEPCTGQMWALLTPDDPYAEMSSEVACDTCDKRVGITELLAYGIQIQGLESPEAA
jgi:hypothetical protein